VYGYVTGKSDLLVEVGKETVDFSLEYNGNDARKRMIVIRGRSAGEAEASRARPGLRKPGLVLNLICFLRLVAANKEKYGCQRRQLTCLAIRQQRLTLKSYELYRGSICVVGKKLSGRCFEYVRRPW
jgi:hypothetical protein